MPTSTTNKMQKLKDRIDALGACDGSMDWILWHESAQAACASAASAAYTAYAYTVHTAYTTFKLPHQITEETR